MELRARAAAAAGVMVLAGCSGPVAATAPAASPATRTACAAVLPRLPEVLAEQRRRSVEPRSPLVLAWGDPAIVLRCGVAEPGPTEDPCVGVNDVDWVARKLRGGYLFVTFGRRPAVEVWVPRDYAPEVNPLVDLAAALDRLPKVSSCA